MLPYIQLIVAVPPHSSQNHHRTVRLAGSVEARHVVGAFNPCHPGRAQTPPARYTRTAAFDATVVSTRTCVTPLNALSITLMVYPNCITPGCQICFGMKVTVFIRKASFLTYLLGRV